MGAANTHATPRQMLTWLGLAAFIIAVDQATKNWILAHYQLGDSTRVLDFFNIVRVHNTGAAFSFLADSGGWQRWFFTGIGLLATVFIVWLLRTQGAQTLFAFALANILGGAVGNVIDRLQHGYVVDFLDFFVGRWHFPAFNVADSAITLGAICLIADEVRRWRQSRR